MPSQQPFPSDVESFIASCIDSVEQIEILLLMRAHASRRWSAEEISRDLRSSSHSIRLRLQQLVAHGLASRDEHGYAYAASHHADKLVERLADAYRERRTAVIERIFSGRKEAMQSFADAFRIRDENEPSDG